MDTLGRMDWQVTGARPQRVRISWLVDQSEVNGLPGPKLCKSILLDVEFGTPSSFRSFS
jgi:hypothetical protein